MAAKKRTSKKRAAGRKPARKTARKKPAKAPKSWAARVAELSPGPVATFEVPWAARQAASWAGASFDPALSTWVAPAGVSSPILDAFAAPFGSWAAYTQNTINGDFPVMLPTAEMAPRTHQVPAIETIVSRAEAGLPGTVIGDDVGLGKTFSTVFGLLELPDLVDVLIVCPVPMVAQWRLAWELCGTVDTAGNTKRVVVISHDSVRSTLLDVPASAAAAKRTKTKRRRQATAGRSIVGWDCVVVDESHKIKNPDAQRTRAVTRCWEADDAYRLYLSATFGVSPLDVLYATDLFVADEPGLDVSDPKQLAGWWAAHGVHLRRGDFGKWEWDIDTAPKRDQLRRVNDLLFAGDSPVGIRRTRDTVGWSDPPRELLPVTLTADQQSLYDTAWSEFETARAELAATGALKPGGSLMSTTEGRAAQLRFTQKASVLKTEQLALWAAEMVEQGQQVAVSVLFVDTRVEFGERLDAAGIAWSEIHGSQSAADKETARVAFQRGEVQVCLFSPAEGISLHAGDTTVGGNNVPRVLLVADPRWSPIPSTQIEGRTNRDGQVAPVFYAYAEQSREQVVLSRMFDRMTDLRTMHGDPENDFYADIDAVLAG